MGGASHHQANISAPFECNERIAIPWVTSFGRAARRQFDGKTGNIPGRDMVNSLPKIAQADLLTVVNHATLPPEAQAPLNDCADIESALDRLEATGFLVEAVRVLAHALPKRESVWWACMCATTTAPEDLTDPDRLAQEYAEQWVRRQKDDLRRAAMEFAESGGCMTAEAWTGIAAFWSGDSLASPGQPPRAPLPQQTGTAVAAAVSLAAVRGDGKRYVERLKRFLQSGRDIASGGNGRLPRES